MKQYISIEAKDGDAFAEELTAHSILGFKVYKVYMSDKCYKALMVRVIEVW